MQHGAESYRDISNLLKYEWMQVMGEHDLFNLLSLDEQVHKFKNLWNVLIEDGKCDPEIRRCNALSKLPSKNENDQGELG